MRFPDTFAGSTLLAMGDDLLPFTAHRIEIRPGVWTAAEGRERDPFQSLRLRVLTDAAGGTLKGERVLDVGCLEGGYSVALAELGSREVIGIDARPQHIARCELLKRELRLDNVHFYREDVKNISRERFGCFDVVFAAGILYHLDDPFQFVATLSEITREFALIDTHITWDDLATHGCSPELQTRRFRGRTFAGRTFSEYPDGSDAEFVKDLPWSAYSNATSFWLTERSLVELLWTMGFEHVSRTYTPFGAFCDEGCERECRVEIIARKTPHRRRRWPL